MVGGPAFKRDMETAAKLEMALAALAMFDSPRESDPIDDERAEWARRETEWARRGKVSATGLSRHPGEVTAHSNPHGKGPPAGRLAAGEAVEEDHDEEAGRERYTLTLISLLTTHYSLITTHCSPLTTH